MFTIESGSSLINLLTRLGVLLTISLNMIKNSKIKDIQLSNPFESISSEIKLIAIDVDGVLTDGSIYFDDLGNQIKRFDSKDGIGVRLLQSHGFEIALISGSKL